MSITTSKKVVALPAAQKKEAWNDTTERLPARATAADPAEEWARSETQPCMKAPQVHRGRR